MTALLVALLAAHLALGLRLRTAPPRAAVPVAWVWLLLSTAFAAWAADDLAPGARFLVLCVSLFLALKSVCHAAARRAGEPPLRAGAWLGYATLAVTMDPAPFALWGGAPLPGSARRLLEGALGTALGLAGWLALAALWRAGAPALLMGALQLVGAYLLLRFGLFRADAGLLGLVGVAARPVFRDPERARSVAELWSARWNRPFSEMLTLAVHRPLRVRVGAARARTAAFLVSGALHEAALSLPVRAGFGLPTLYFVLQAALVAWEARRGPLGWAGTFAVVLLPLPLVFHPPFVREVLLPLLGPRG